MAGANGLIFAIAAMASAGLIVLLRPLLVRHALVQPNARSSHREPTPQGGGIAVIAATIIAVGCTVVLIPGLLSGWHGLIALTAATIGLAIVGATDDIRPLEAAPRLLLQGIAVAIVIAALPEGLRILPVIPWWVERALLLVGGVWFVNAVNFMDGIDWMTVAEVVPVTVGLALLGLMGALPPDATVVAFAIGGAIVGFAPFNRPVAQLFLGDVGSLPIGLLLGWLLVLLAGSQHFAAALLLPLYYVADATITLLRRLANGEQVMQAHRSHFYQRALNNGLTVSQIVGRVFAVNIVLVGLAAATMSNASLWFQAAMLAIGSGLVGALLWNFNRARA